MTANGQLRLDSNGCLPHPYALVVAQVEPFNGMVEPTTTQLFRRGYSPRAHAIDSTSVQILAHGATREPVFLAVVATPSGDLQDASPIAVATLALAPLRPTRVTVFLDRQGEVTLSAEPAPQTTPTSLDDILRGVPKQVDVLGRASLDCVCIVDLVGRFSGAEPRFVRWRVEFARKLIASLKAAFPLPDALRVAVIGYSDVVHVRAERLSTRALGPTLQEVPFGSAEDVVPQLDRFQVLAHPAHDFPGALEEALERASKLDWFDGSSHAVVVITSRPPHPAQSGEHRLLPSPARIDWQRSVKRLQDYRAARTILVECPADWPTDSRPLSSAVHAYMAECWGAIGRDGQYQLEQTRPEVLASNITAELGMRSGGLRLPLLADTLGV